MKALGGRTPIVEDSYEPATLEDAWTEYRNAHPQNNSPVGYATFRAGYRRGVAQGAVIASTTFVHAVNKENPHQSGDGGEQ